MRNLKMNMNSRLYAETITDLPIVEVESERLSDGSTVWNLTIGHTVIPCTSEKHAGEAFRKIAAAVKKATSENIEAFS